MIRKINNGDGFVECDTCHASLGSPPLCTACQHNRKVISDLSRTAIERQDAGRYRAALERIRDTLTPSHMIGAYAAGVLSGEIDP